MADSTPTCHEELKVKSYSYTSSAILAQCAATFVVGITYFGIGAIYMIPTIVVGNLLNANNDDVSLNSEEASWFGGLPFLVMPLGALSGILVQNYLGQRYGLIISNVLGLVSLINLYYAKTFMILLISSTLSGMSLGFTEPSVMSYISEYSEPKIRGFLCSATISFSCFGIFFQSFMGTIVHWRVGTLSCALVPSVSLILLFLIPDSPIWLLSKGKRRKAMKALTWFRGWVDIKVVEEEFEDLKIHVNKSLIYDERNLQEERINLTGINNQGSETKQKDKKLTLSDLLMSLFEKRTLRPFFLLIIYEFIILVASSTGARSYVMNLFESLQIPVDGQWGALTVGAAMAVGTLSNTVILRFTKKRKIIAIVSLIATSLISISLGAYVHHKDQMQASSWLFVGLTFLLNFLSTQAMSIPWLMLGEVFSVKNGTLACGMTAAIFDLLIFLFLKTYFVLDELLGPSIFFSLNGLGGIVGSLYLYFYLPEIEGKSLAEIDKIFSKK